MNIISIIFLFFALQSNNIFSSQWKENRQHIEIQSIETITKKIDEINNKIANIKPYGYFVLGKWAMKSEDAEKLSNLENEKKSLLTIQEINKHLPQKQALEHIEIIEKKTLDISSKNISDKLFETVMPLILELNKTNQIELLNISNNNLTRLPDELFELANIKRINASMNKLNEISYKIGKLKNLIELNLSDNNLQEIPFSICTMENLEILNISRNHGKVYIPTCIKQGLKIIGRYATTVDEIKNERLKRNLYEEKQELLKDGKIRYKNSANIIIILDRESQMLDPKEAMQFKFYSSLEQKIPILVAGAVVKNFLQLKKEIPKIYEIYKLKSADLYLLIPNHIIFKEAFELNKAVKIAIEKLKEMLEKNNWTGDNGNYKSDNWLEGIKSIFKKNTDFYWNIFIAGHGTPNATICNLTIKDFKNFLFFLNQNDINTYFLFYSTCYGGGKKLINLYADVNNGLIGIKPLKFIIVSGSTGEKVKYAIRMNYKEIFVKLNKILNFSYIKDEERINIGSDPMRSLLNIIKKNITDNELSTNFPLIKFPNSKFFISIGKDEGVTVINKIILQKHKFEKKAITIPDKTKVIFVYPNIIDIEIEILGKKAPLFVSLDPGPTIHFLSKIVAKKIEEQDIFNLFVEKDLKKREKLKIFIISELETKNHKYRNVVVDSENNVVFYETNNFFYKKNNLDKIEKNKPITEYNKDMMDSRIEKESEDIKNVQENEPIKKINLIKERIIENKAKRMPKKYKDEIYNLINNVISKWHTSFEEKSHGVKIEIENTAPWQTKIEKLIKYMNREFGLKFNLPQLPLVVLLKEINKYLPKDRYIDQSDFLPYKMIDLSKSNLSTEALKKIFTYILKINSIYPIKYLDLSRNNIKQIPDKICELKNLKNLMLYENDLISLPDSIGKLKNLEKLNIGINKLSKIPSSIGMLKKLNMLRAFGNKLTMLPDSIADLEGLTELSLSNNKLTHIPDSIGKLKKLKILQVFNNKLTMLPDFIIDLEGLTELIISYNELTHIPDSIGKLKNLEKLNLGKNKLSKIPSSIGMLKKLKILQVFNNKLTKLPDFIIDLEGLTELDLSSNEITYIPDSIGKLKKLKILYAFSNKLTKLPDYIGDLEGLTELILSYNELTHIPDSIGKLKNLEKLNLGKNKLSKIPRSIGMLKKLKILKVFSNKLTKLPDFIRDLEGLTELDLSSNELTNIPDSIGKLKKLKILHAFRNKLTQLPDSIGDLEGLTELIISYNELTHIPDSIGKLKNLEKLNLGKNKLLKIPSSIGMLKKLKILHAFRNKLTKLPDFIGDLEGLTELYLSYNELTHIPDSIGNLKNLEILDIRNNKIESIPEEILKLPKLKTLKFENNKVNIKLPEGLKTN